jgi:hypothetical protein
VVTAPKKKEIITTMGKDPMPISTHCLIYSFQNICLFSVAVNMPLSIIKYLPNRVIKFIGLF